MNPGPSYWKRRNSLVLITGTLFLLFTPSCTSKSLLQAPVLESEEKSTEQIRYIEQTDQNDRRKNLMRFLLFPNGKVVREIEKRDSIRANRMMEFLELGKVQTESEQFTAGLILMHSRDSLHREKAYQVFEKLELQGETAAGRKTGAHWKTLVRGVSKRP